MSYSRLLTRSRINHFHQTVWNHYSAHQRSMPWRTDPTPYYVLVSELMLQQTQVSRVIPKFEAFIRVYPTVSALANADLADVLVLWSGLGYNRRAKFLWMAARSIVDDYSSVVPRTQEELQSLPGVGRNTAGAILAYAYNQPVVFIETNIRTVLFHHFYADAVEAVSDRDLLELVRQTLDETNPREWYWALMDYGTHLKKTAGGRLAQSRQYKKQPPLAGSQREMRGRIIKALTEGSATRAVLKSMVTADERFLPALQALEKEGLIAKRNGWFRLTDSGNS